MAKNVLFKHDGQIADKQELEDYGFWSLLDASNDFEKDSRGRILYDFVGIIVQSSGSVLAVLPKHFRVVDERSDLSTLFSLVLKASRHYDGSSDRVASDRLEDYPFAAFVSIYDHYRRWGLDIQFDSRYILGPPGVVDWRHTIQRGSWVPTSKDVVPFPVVYRSSQRNESFLSRCTVFAIEHTIELFGYFLNVASTGFMKPSFDLEADRKWIVDELIRLKALTFRDRLRSLIDSLLSFYRCSRSTGDFFLKTRSFSVVWESAVLNYLNTSFVGINDGGMPIFSKGKGGLEFSKTPFYTNRSDAGQSINPDFYAYDADLSEQYVFDAKYYTKLRELDYKQLAYTALLSGLRGGEDSRKFCSTHSILFLPFSSFGFEEHFSPNDSLIDLGKWYRDFRIGASYLDARDVLLEYDRR